MAKQRRTFTREFKVVGYRFIEDHRNRWPVRLICEVLGVSPGGYYGWRRPPSARQQRSEALVAAIKAVHAEASADLG